MPMTFTIEISDETTEMRKGKEHTEVYVAKVQHWPPPGDIRQPNEYGYGETQQEAAIRGLIDMFTGMEQSR